MVIVSLTSAVGQGRPAIYINAAQIISFADQSSGGCQIKFSNGNVVVVVENANTVSQLIAEASRS
jgi:hypothetical protein